MSLKVTHEQSNIGTEFHENINTKQKQEYKTGMLFFNIEYY